MRQGKTIPLEKVWLNLWRTFALTLAQLALGLVIILFCGLVKTTVHAY